MINQGKTSEMLAYRVPEHSKATDKPDRKDKKQSRSTVAPNFSSMKSPETSSRPYLLKNNAPYHPDVIVR